MTIKQQGGVFGRNPTFNNVAADGGVSTNTISEKTATSGVTVDGVLLKDGNTWVSGTNPSMRMVQTDETDKNFSFRLNGDTLLFERRNDAFTVATQLLNVNTATGNIAFPSGQGIDFSATSGTGTSELFDDYEEGTWTPASVVGSATAASGVYTKIGRQVSVIGTLTFPVQTDAGLATITGLPFTSGATGSGGTLRYTNFGSAFFLYGVPSTTTINCFNTAGAPITYTTISGKRVDFAMTYFV